MSMLAKTDGIGMHFIGIGDDVIMSQLAFMASRPANAVHLKDISDLEGDSALHQLYTHMQGGCLRHHQSPSLCSRSVPWLGEGLSMLLPHLPILRYPLPDGTLPVVI